jgi:lysophospholipase L1-like esterase
MLEQGGHTMMPALAADSQAAYGGKVATTASRYRPASDADVLVVELGTNDYSGFGASSPTTLADFGKGYAGILDAARSARASVRLMCVSVWQPASQPNALGIPASDYDKVIRDLCEARKGIVVTVQPILSDQANHSSPGQLSSFGAPDSFHPGDAGHLLIATAIYDLLPRLWARL